ncbi:MAG: hypothetical protein AB1645_01455 [Bacillota bacterium]|jgi:hypothetical protein
MRVRVQEREGFTYLVAEGWQFLVCRGSECWYDPAWARQGAAWLAGAVNAQDYLVSALVAAESVEKAQGWDRREMAERLARLTQGAMAFCAEFSPHPPAVLPFALTGKDVYASRPSPWLEGQEAFLGSFDVEEAAPVGPGVYEAIVTAWNGHGKLRRALQLQAVALFLERETWVDADHRLLVAQLETAAAAEGVELRDLLERELSKEDIEHTFVGAYLLRALQEGVKERESAEGRERQQAAVERAVRAWDVARAARLEALVAVR